MQNRSQAWGTGKYLLLSMINLMGKFLVQTSSWNYVVLLIHGKVHCNFAPVQKVHNIVSQRKGCHPYTKCRMFMLTNRQFVDTRFLDSSTQIKLRTLSWFSPCGRQLLIVITNQSLHVILANSSPHAYKCIRTLIRTFHLLIDVVTWQEWNYVKLQTK